MTFQRMINAQCDADDCLSISNSSGYTVEEAWAYAKEEGWHRNGNRTVCPVCWDEDKR